MSVEEKTLSCRLEQFSKRYKERFLSFSTRNAGPGKFALRARCVGQRPGFSLLTSPVDKTTPIQLQKQVPGSLYEKI